MNYISTKTHNHKVGLYTEYNELYMSIDANTTIKDSKTENKVLVHIPKIKLSNMNIEMESKFPIRDCFIKIPIVPVDAEFFNFKLDETKKKMTLEEIETALGYKVEIIK